MDTQSPVISPEGEIKEVKEIKQMDFPNALREVIGGLQITKLEWNNKNIYGLLENGKLMLHKDDNKMYQWIISEGDLLGEDWVVVEKPN
jgi:hypothetical protein